MASVGASFFVRGRCWLEGNFPGKVNVSLDVECIAKFMYAGNTNTVDDVSNDEIISKTRCDRGDMDTIFIDLYNNLIHEAYSLSWSVVITILHVVSVHPFVPTS